MNKIGIYRIINIKNGKFYIGSSINITKRWYDHKRTLRKGIHDNDYLQKSWNKYGENNFEFNIIEIIENVTDLLIREQYHLDVMKPFDKDKTYNICGFANNMLGFKHSDETKMKLSKIHKGNKYNLGNKHSDETKKMMSISHTGEKHYSETIIKLIKTKTGVGHSSETKNKLSNIKKGKPALNKRKVYQLDTDGNTIKLWDSLTDAANNYNIDPSRISSVCNGRTKICIGFKWVYFSSNEKTKLTDTIKKEIINLYKTGYYSTRKLADLFNISKSTIWNVVNK